MVWSSNNTSSFIDTFSLHKDGIFCTRTLESSIQQLEDKIDEILLPYQEQVELLLTIPGVKKHSVACIIAEIGVEMNQFPSAHHLASWAGLSPGNHESAGKKKHPNNQRKPTHPINTL
ncbi:IS110 family transposase [Bacillus mycoides]|uniref:IS110 family transposase n=1 Tax=Bacillus mycoides TaxID=1405 RepID=UPI0006ACD381|nr:IS110 family transposase [Bacillus mycoides]